MSGKSINRIVEESFPEEVKAEIVANISAGCRSAKEWGSEISSISRKSRYSAKMILGTFVERHLADAVTFGHLPFSFSEERVTVNGYRYVEFLSDSVRWQVKQTSSPGKFPNQSSFRENRSISNQRFLGTQLTFPTLLIEDSNLPFAILTYGHNDFELKFVSIGFPEFAYKGWIKRFSLSIADDRIKTFEEKILEENTPRIKESILKEIQPRKAIQ